MSQYLFGMTLTNGLVQAVKFQNIQAIDLPVVPGLVPGGYTFANLTIDQFGRVVSAANGGLGPGYRFLQVVYITSIAVGTYTPSAGVRALLVKCVGAGGGGGGCVTAATNAAASGGGGSGAFAQKFITGTIKSQYSVQVGAANANSIGGNGQVGNSTTFDSPSVCTAGGGAGAIADSVAAGPRSGTRGASGGSFLAGDFGFQGAPGTAGAVYSASAATGGTGGNSAFGSGGIGTITNGNGANGGDIGGGGGGAVILSGGASNTGGGGVNGVIIIEEYV